MGFPTWLGRMAKKNTYTNGNTLTQELYENLNNGTTLQRDILVTPEKSDTSFVVNGTPLSKLEIGQERFNKMGELADQARIDNNWISNLGDTRTGNKSLNNTIQNSDLQSRLSTLKSKLEQGGIISLKRIR